MADTTQFFLNNRQLIKGLGMNTSSTSTPTYTSICSTSEVSLDTDFEEKDFYTFCDALKRNIITGCGVTLKLTVKYDANNAAIIAIQNMLNTMITSGDVTTFNNVLWQFQLLTSVTSNVLTYKTYTAPFAMKISDFGGAAEDESGFTVELALQGPATAAA